MSESSWVSVKERLPDKDGWYMVTSNGRDVHSAHFLLEYVATFQSNLSVNACTIRWWQPLPAPPPSPPTKDEALREVVNLIDSCRYGWSPASVRPFIDLLPRLRAALGET